MTNINTGSNFGVMRQSFVGFRVSVRFGPEYPESESAQNLGLGRAFSVCSGIYGAKLAVPASYQRKTVFLQQIN